MKTGDKVRRIQDSTTNPEFSDCFKIGETAQVISVSGEDITVRKDKNDFKGTYLIETLEVIEDGEKFKLLKAINANRLIEADAPDEILAWYLRETISTDICSSYELLEKAKNKMPIRGINFLGWLIENGFVEVEETYRVGDKFLISGKSYLLMTTSYEYLSKSMLTHMPVFLVEIRTGKVSLDSVRTVKNAEKITVQEINQLADTDSWECIAKCGEDIGE